MEIKEYNYYDEKNNKKRKTKTKDLPFKSHLWKCEAKPQIKIIFAKCTSDKGFLIEYISKFYNSIIIKSNPIKRGQSIWIVLSKGDTWVADMHVKRHSTSLVIRYMLIKMTIRYTTFSLEW